MLPYNNFPIPVDLEDVFLVKFVLQDGSEEIDYYLSEGDFWDGRQTTVQFLIEE